VLVGFEDMFGGGDLDFNDLVFSFTNVTPGDNTAAWSHADRVGIRRRARERC
jgi:hypothetical protein